MVDGNLVNLITIPTETERAPNEKYQKQYRHPIEDVEAGIDTFFPNIDIIAG